MYLLRYRDSLWSVQGFHNNCELIIKLTPSNSIAIKKKWRLFIKIHKLIESLNFTIGIVGLVFLNSVIGEMKNIKFKHNLTLY